MLINLTLVNSQGEVIRCDFENQNACNWKQEVNNDDFDWTIQSGPTPSADTGPPSDHTTGNSTGYYAFIEASSPRRVQDMAVLKSPLVRLVYAPRYCIIR